MSLIKLNTISYTSCLATMTIDGSDPNIGEWYEMMEPWSDGIM